MLMAWNVCETSLLLFSLGYQHSFLHQPLHKEQTSLYIACQKPYSFPSDCYKATVTLLP